MRPTLVATTDEKHPTYLYFDLESKRFILTAQIGIGGTWLTNNKAKKFVDRPDVTTIEPDDWYPEPWALLKG